MELTQQLAKILNESTNLLPGSLRGQKRRAASPPEFEGGKRGLGSFRAPEHDKRKAARHSRRPSSNTTAVFQTGTGENLNLAPCAICLSRAPHNIRTCKAKTRWDGKPTLYSRNPDHRIIDSQGHIICSDWQRPTGCTGKHRHECSGCGSRSHGACDCSFAQPRNHNPSST